MKDVSYRIVEHDVGWVYRVNRTYPETFPGHDSAFGAARRAARKQLRPGDTTGIVWEDDTGHWRAELSRASDKPQTEVIR